MVEIADPLADLVERFSEALLAKLCAAEAKYGYDDAWRRGDGWRDELIAKMHQHIAKGDPRDVAAYCAFAWHHGWSLAQPAAVAGAAEITMGLGLNDVTEIRHEGRRGILFRPRPSGAFIPVGDEGELQPGPYWPAPNDVVIWIENPEGAAVILDYLAPFLAQPATPAPAARAEGWQPIETAPKDGTSILLWMVHPNAKFSEDPVAEGWECAVVAHWIDHNGGGWTWHGMLGKATSWMPIPLPAAADDVASGGGQ